MFVLRFDLRIPPFVTNLTHAEQYREFLRMVEWSDDKGFAAVVLSEHHGTEDGYMNSPLLLAGSVLGRTSNVFCSVSALLLPLHDSLRIAEEIATIDLIAPGRFNVVIGVGYRESEFEMFGKNRKTRGKDTEEGIRTVLTALKGKPFTYNGREVLITPQPVSDPSSLISVGGSVEISAKRAARLGLSFVPAVRDENLESVYYEEAKAVGYENPMCMMPSGPGMVIVTEDPERTWNEIGDNLIYDAISYAAWQYKDQRSSWHIEGTSIEELKAGGQHLIVTPDECVDLVKTNGAAVLHPLIGGIDPSIGWESLELVANKVIPTLN
ncbi:MAG: LLM class flavin-dependent oxidoreductase [Actinobacteria bacterium]|nr:LLM class flavin-dependent oxidoreductase [Actinomycetota bacterium]